jgi:hypothetical protein
MLFDLRGRGRRRVVKVVYVGFAVLIGVGLIGFGVGGGLGGGGLLTAATNNEGGSSASFASQIKKYRKLTETQPNNAGAWEKLAKALLHEAGGEAYVNTTTGAVTSKGKALFRQASEAWSSYIALNPPKPSSELAQLITRIYGEEGLNEPAKAVQALQIVVAARPESAAYYSQLAEFAYKANNPRVGDLASGKAVALAPANQKVRLKKEFEEVKKYPHGGQTFTTTTNGKTYALKKGANGQFQGTEIKKPKTPPTKTSTTKK